MIGRGHGIHWNQFDEDIGIEGLLAGKPLGESQTSFKKWLSAEGLIDAGFSSIVAIRDVSPDFEPSEVEKLRAGLRYKLRTKPVEVVFVLGVMEVEAWFIAEHTHFEKISPSLTPDLIKTKLGFDPRTDDLQQRTRPAEDLKSCYRLVGHTYNKNAAIVQRTVSVLDYERVWLELPSRFPDVKELVTAIDNFLTE